MTVELDVGHERMFAQLPPAGWPACLPRSVTTTESPRRGPTSAASRRVQPAGGAGSPRRSRPYVVQTAGFKFARTLTQPSTRAGRCSATRRVRGRAPSVSQAVRRPPRSRTDADEGGLARLSERPSRFQRRGVRSPSWCSTVGKMSTIRARLTFEPSPGPGPSTNTVSSSRSCRSGRRGTARGATARRGRSSPGWSALEQVACARADRRSRRPMRASVVASDRR